MAKNNLDIAFQRCRDSKKKALIAYLAAGYPAFSDQERIIATLEKSGVDILELGIPFSDPIADGPTIQYASQASLDRGTTLKKIIHWTRKLRRRTTIPIVYMSYLNPLVAYGMERFARDASDAGVQGVIVPDLIPEEASRIRRALENRGLYLIHLVAPTTPIERQRRIARLSKGFLYAVSVRGVTGARVSLPAETQRWLGRLRSECPVPLCVGFGISGPKQIRQLKKSVDGFIVGSALIDQIRTSRPSERINRIKTFISPLIKECSNGRTR